MPHRQYVLTVPKVLRGAWVRLIEKVFEANPSVCPQWGGEMRVLSVIEEPMVIERILRHVGLWDPCPPSHVPPEDDDWPVNGKIPLTYCGWRRKAAHSR